MPSCRGRISVAPFVAKRRKRDFQLWRSLSSSEASIASAHIQSAAVSRQKILKLEHLFFVLTGVRGGKLMGHVARKPNSGEIFRTKFGHRN